MKLYARLGIGMVGALVYMVGLIQTAAMKNILSDAYKGSALFASLFTTAGPYTTAGTEPSGGSPAYARKSIPWGTSANGVVSGTVTFDVPSGATIQGTGMHSAVPAGTYYDGNSGTSQSFSSQGTYQLTLTYTQT